MILTTMRVAHFAGNGMISMIDKPVPAPGVGQLVLKVGANALGGSERGQFFAAQRAARSREGWPPRIGAGVCID